MYKNALFMKWQELSKRDASVAADTLRININRQHFLSFIAIPVSLVHIVYFYFFLTPSTLEEAHWRIGIVSIHCVLVVLFSIVLMLTRHYRLKEQQPKWMGVFLWLQMMFFLVIGAIIASIDQLVTANITPFLVAVVIIATVFLTPFPQVVITYLFGYSVFCYAIGFTQVSEAVLLSNRVNGVTIVGIGIGLSYVLWKAHCKAILQSRFIQQQHDDLEKKNKELYQLASIDLLTGLYSRRRFEEIMKEKVATLKIHQESLSVIVMDIDYFKKVNDQWGHPVGDMVLKEMSQCLLKEKRQQDIISRWGGEEVLIALFDTPLIEAKAIAESFRLAIERMSVVIDEQVIKVTASFGIAQVDKIEDFHSFELAYRHADEALYRAKQDGRNCVKVFE